MSSKLQIVCKEQYLGSICSIYSGVKINIFIPAKYLHVALVVPTRSHIKFHSVHRFLFTNEKLKKLFFQQNILFEPLLINMALSNCFVNPQKNTATSTPAFHLINSTRQHNLHYITRFYRQIRQTLLPVVLGTLTAISNNDMFWNPSAGDLFPQLLRTRYLFYQKFQVSLRLVYRPEVSLQAMIYSMSREDTVPVVLYTNVY